MQSALQHGPAELSPAIMWFWNTTQPETIRKPPLCLMYSQSMAWDTNIWRMWKNQGVADWTECTWELHVERGSSLRICGIFFSVFAPGHTTCFCSKYSQGQRSLSSDVWGTCLLAFYISAEGRDYMASGMSMKRTPLSPYRDISSWVHIQNAECGVKLVCFIFLTIHC